MGLGAEAIGELAAAYAEARLTQMLGGGSDSAVRALGRGLSSISFHASLEGEREVIRQFRALGGKFPKKYLTKAAKEGGKEPLAKARELAPRDTGALKKGIKYIRETPSKRTKAVYRMVFNRKYNNIFQKPIKNVGIYGGKKDTGYYPVSQEYGFKSKSGYTRGKYFLRRAIDSTASQSEVKMIESLNQSIDDILR